MDTSDPALARIDYEAVERSPEFQELVRRRRGFVLPCTAFFLSWYLGFIVLCAYAPDFMSQKVYKEINVGLLFGFGQFISTFVITILYVRWADREFDPRAEALHDRLEEGQR